MPRSAALKGRHISYNADGELCMTVVDPVTRKLLIPTRFIFDTRAQQRGTLPSLCQLFLAGRCRQGQGCYQVHADWHVVQRLRSEVDSLPCCCPEHGDKDHLGVLEYALLRDALNTGADTAANESVVTTRDVVVYVAGCTMYEGSYVPLDRLSYTVGLRRLLEEQQVLLAQPESQVSLLNPETGFPEDKIVADASAATVCRLHAMDRCRYAEECKFLHLCKELTTADPQLMATSSATATAAECSSAPYHGAASFENSMTSAGLSGVAAMGASLSSVKGRSQHHGSASLTGAPRQSVFTSISLQQQHQPPPPHSLPHSSYGGPGTESIGGRPLLVPQCEDTAIDLPDAMQSGHNMPSNIATATSSSRTRGHLPGYPSSTILDPSMLQQVDAYGLGNAAMNASTGSFPGNSSYGYGSNAGRIRVSLSLTMANPFLPHAQSGSGAALGTSNSSEKTASPPAEAGLGLVHGGTSSMPDFARSMPVGYGGSSQPHRWHHNPYASSLSRCEATQGGSYGGCFYAGPAYPSQGNGMDAMTH